MEKISAGSSRAKMAVRRGTSSPTVCRRRRDASACRSTRRIRRSSTPSCRAIPAAQVDLNSRVQQGRWSISHRRWRRTLDPRIETGSASLLLQPDPRGPHQTHSTSIFSRTCCWCRTTAATRGARISSTTYIRTTHALVVDPTNPEHVLIGTDGGLFQSFSEGATWEHLDRFAGGELYRINVDRSTPFRVCGGLQDNTNWVGPSDTRSGEGIRNGDWQTLQGGDGSYCAFDPVDSTVVYAESQQASVRRVDLKTGQITMSAPIAQRGRAGVSLQLARSNDHEPARDRNSVPRRQRHLQAHRPRQATGRSSPRI